MLVLVLLLAGVAESLSLSTLLPLLSSAVDGVGTGGDDRVSQFVAGVFGWLGLEPSLTAFVLFIVIAIACKNLLVFVAEQRTGYLAADVATSLRLELLDAVSRSRWSYFVGQSSGKLANAMATEAWRASNAYVYAIGLLVLAIEAIVFTVLAVLVSWQATLLCVLASVVILRLSQRFVRLSRKGGEGQTRSYRGLLRLLTDLLGSVKTLKVTGREHLARALLVTETEDLSRSLKREVLGNAALTAAQEPLYMAVLGVGIVVALDYLAMQVSTVVFLVLILLRLLKQFGKVQKQYQKMMASESAYLSIQATINDAQAALETSTGDRTPTMEQGISLDDVSFGYGSEYVLERASLHIAAGAITCVTGGSGTGKSTLADLVMGLQQPDEGAVCVDGVDLKTLDLVAWRRGIGYVPQENALLHDTIYANVALADEEVERPDVERALRDAGAWAFVAALPDGLDTNVGEAGRRLSGGQRQRILVARALVHGPRLLVLDEATSSLDPPTEQALCETFAALRGKVTMLAISHQQALATMADRVYRIDAKRLQLVSDVGDRLESSA